MQHHFLSWAVRSTRKGPSRFTLAARRAGVAFLVVMLVASTSRSVEAQGSTPTITSPTVGQVLQGQVAITGSTGALSFGSAELDFAYASDQTNTWFLIDTISQPVSDGTITTWDTTKISDGAYILRLRVFETDGSYQDATLTLEVANYTVPAIASATAEPTSPPSVQIPTPLVIAPSPTAAPMAVPTPSPLPPNPASLSTDLIYGGLRNGAVIAIAAVLLFGAILFRRRS